MASRLALLLWFFTGCLLLIPSDARAVITVERQRSVAAIMAAEYALQNNDLKVAAIEYVKAARYSDDIALSERASRLAMTAEMPELSRQALQRWRQLAPESSAMLGLSLSLAIKQGEADIAYDYSKQLLSQSSPEHHMVLLDVLGSEKADKGVISRAVMRDIVSRREIIPDQATLWIQLWLLSGQLGEETAELALAEALAAKFPQDARAQVITAIALRDKGELPESLAMLVRATELSPQTHWVKQAVLAEFNEVQAWAEGDRYLSSMPQDENVVIMRGRFVLASEQIESADKLYSQLLKSEIARSTKIQFLQGQLSERLGRWSESEKIYQGITQGVEYDRAQLRLPVVLQKQNRITEALAKLHTYQKKPDADGEYVRDSYLVEAGLFDEPALDKKAMNAFQRGLAIFENDPLLLYGRALQHEKMLRITAALLDLKAVITQNEQNAEALNAYGYVLAKHRKAYPQAMVYLERAIKLKPASPEIMNSYGWVKLKLGQKQESLTWLEKAWFRAKAPEMAAHLGEAYWALGRKDDARKVWAQGHKINPQHTVWTSLKKHYSP
jgi:tetratricopeptide (TPR) repeat protein